MAIGFPAGTPSLTLTNLNNGFATTGTPSYVNVVGLDISPTDCSFSQFQSFSGCRSFAAAGTCGGVYVRESNSNACNARLPGAGYSCPQ